MTSPCCSESCPNVGSIEMYERHCALENHLLYGKYKFLPVRETLIVKDKVPHKGGLLDPVRSQHGLVNLSGGI